MLTRWRAHPNKPIRDNILKTLLSKEIQIQFSIIINGLSMRFEQMMNLQGRYHQTSSTTVHLALNEDDLSLKVLRRKKILYDLLTRGGLKIPDKEVKYVPVQTVMLPSIITTEH